MNYKYAGKDYFLNLNDDGQIECTDLGVQAPSLEEVKKLVREQVEKEKSLPRVSILTFGDGHRRWRTQYFVGTSTLKNVGSNYNNQVWISYKDEKGKVCRAKTGTSDVYENTPENRERLDKYVQLQKQIEKLEEEASEVRGDCTRVSAIKV